MIALRDISETWGTFDVSLTGRGRRELGGFWLGGLVISEVIDGLRDSLKHVSSGKTSCYIGGTWDNLSWSCLLYRYLKN